MDGQTLTVPQLLRLSHALCREDAGQALDEALLALRTMGLESDNIPTAGAELPTGVSLPLLFQVATESRVLRLHGNPQLCADSLTLLQQLLFAALLRAEEQGRLRQISERAQMLSEASFEGIMIHENGVVIDANDRLAELLGAEPSEVRGEWPMRHCVAEEDRAAVLDYIVRGYEGAYVIGGVRKDGSHFLAELQSKQGKLGTRPVRVVAVRDVTERERTIRLLRESEQRLRELAEAVFDVTILSQDGRMTDVAGNTQAIFGLQASEVVGRHVFDFVAPDSQSLVKHRIFNCTEGAYEAVVLNAKGLLVPVEVIAVSSTLDGQPTRVSGLRDLREPRRVEAERRHLERQLERAQRMDSLGVLAGGIAHDFNNLLVGILGNADLLLLDATASEQRETLEAIVAAAQQAAELTSRLLAYAGRGEAIARRPIDIGLLLRELRVLLAAKMSPKAEFVLDLEAGATVEADRSALSQVLMNLLTNASDALGSASGRIDVRVRSVKQPEPHWDDAFGAAVEPGDWVLIEIQDTGAGMNEATVERIFEPFFTTKRTGHGLGLAACLGIVSAHGGAIRVDSQEGKGSRFSLLLPSTEVRPAAAAPAQNAQTTSPCRVLIIDDEPIVRAHIKRSLELHGYTVKQASSGTSGLAIALANQADVIILDMTMPDLDGAQVVTELRRLGCEVPILLSSGYLSAETERRLQPGSFQGFLRKPFSVAELLIAIEQARQECTTGC